LVEVFIGKLKGCFVPVPCFLQENLHHAVFKPVTITVHAVSVHQNTGCHVENELVGS
jgi:hypothetical protein